MLIINKLVGYLNPTYPLLQSTLTAHRVMGESNGGESVGTNLQATKDVM